MHESADDLEIVFCNKPIRSYVIPDGGYGWVAVFAAFMNSALIDGMFYSFGIIRLALIDYLPPMESGSFLVNLIGALQISFPLLSGPLGSVLGKKFGFRKISMAGGFISALCFLICFFAPPNIFVFYIFYGVIGGMGLGMIFMAGIITISEYFDKKRPLSTGIAVCGTGFGIFVMGSLMSIVIDCYSWHGALFILAAISFQTICFSCLLRPLEVGSVEIYDKTMSACNSRLTIPQRRTSINMKLAPISSGTEMAIFSREAIDTAIKSGFISSFLDLNTMMETMGAQMPETQDVMYLRSITNITSVPVPHEWNVVHVTSNTNNDTNEDTYELRINRWNIFRYFYFKPVCFRNIQLLLYYSSALMFSFCYTLPFYYISARLVEDFEFSSIRGGAIVSIMGLSSLFCRLGTGVLSTLLPNHKIWVYVACLVMCGTANIFSNWFQRIYPLWILWGILVGGGLGGIITLESVILAEMVPIDDMASAFGSYQLTCGLGTLLGPPTAGFMFDVWTSYNLIFWICGVVFILSGLIVIPIQLMPNNQ